MKCSRCERTAVSFPRWCLGAKRVRCRHCRADLHGDQWLRVLVPSLAVVIFVPALAAAYHFTHDVMVSLYLSSNVALLLAVVVAVSAWFFSHGQPRRLVLASKAPPLVFPS